MASSDESSLPPLRKAGCWLVYVAYRIVESVIRALPIGVGFRFGGSLGWLASFLLPGYRRLALANLRIAFGREMCEPELKRLCRRHFKTLGANLFCSFKIPFMKPEEVAARTEITGLEGARKVIADGRGLMYALMHMGNWEALAQLEQMGAGARPSTMFQRLGNPYLNAHVTRLRARVGCKLFDRKDGFFGPIKWLKQNNVMGILADQHAGDAGVWAPFFGRLASTTNLPQLLAERTGSAILPVGVKTTGCARWTYMIGEPLRTGSSPDVAAAEMNAALEKLIRESPADWFWVHNRWKTPNPDFLLQHYKRGVALPGGVPMESLQRFEILIRSTNWLGDACMSIPAVRAIKRGRPDARVTVLTLSKLADIWRMVKDVDAVIEIPSGGGLGAARKAIKASGVRYDVAVLFPNSSRVALEVRGLAQRLIGYKGHWRSKLLDQIIPPKRQPGPIEHHAGHYLRIAARIGADVSDPTLKDPLPSSARPGEGPLRIGLCAGAEYGPAKRWPVERFAAAAKQVLETMSAEWILFGGSNDSAIGAELEKLLGGKCRNLTGQTTLRQLCDELCQCSLLLTNDTGTMHLAAALGVPTVSIFGSTEPRWTGPLGSGHVILRRHVECSPCFLRECPLDFRCMKGIEPAQAAEAILEKLSASALRESPGT